MKKIVKILIVAAIVAVALVIFFWPKACGNAGTALGVTNSECDCIGIKQSPLTPGGGDITCFGLPLSRTCWQLGIGGARVIVPC